MNKNWELGLSSSIHAGLAALADCETQATGVLILGCDQPRLTAAHLRALLEAFVAQPIPRIVASAYDVIVGIPSVFPREVFGELCALRGDKGARSLLMRPPCPLRALPFLGGEIDIDMPEDLAQMDG